MITDNRKRKQEDIKNSNVTNNSSWSDFIYSSPSSPSATDNFNFDSFFLDQQHQLSLDPVSGTNSRRHSVAIGEMDYHSFDFLKQETQDNNVPCWDDLHLLLNNHSHNNNNMSSSERPIHKRTLSLREDNPHYATLLSPTLSTTSTGFFSNGFLDALIENNNNNNNNNNTNSNNNNNNNHDNNSIHDNNNNNIHDNNNNTINSINPNSNQLTNHDIDMLTDSNNQHDFLKLSEFNHHNTITPSAITTELNTMADWLLDQQKKQKLSPDSPTHTLGSSISPSPPITPMQPVSLGFEPIQKQEDSNQHRSCLINARAIQGETNAASLKPFIQDYLIRRENQDRSLPVTGERTIMILTSRVAQKSYGTEKRFLCPPPTTILKGANWWTNSSDPDKVENKSTFASGSPKLTIHISGETINQTGVIEWQSSNGTMMDPSSAANPTTHSSSISGRCVSKQLYINDADEKRKRVEVLAKIQLGHGLQLGTFPSKGIKVISKPSKKRQSIKNMELCIHHGTTISLFNRIRSQTVSTKYLGVSQSNENGTCFVARTGSWDPFVIWIVDTAHTPESQQPPSPNPDFPPPPAIALHTTQPMAVHYNQPVVLQCVTTGLVSPVMIVRKVDRGSMVLGGHRSEPGEEKAMGGECGDEVLGDPVSQLHKVAFQIVQDPSFSSQKTGIKSDAYPFQIPQACHPVTYLACLNDVVGMHKTNYQRHLIATFQTSPEEVIDDESKKARRRISSDKGRRGSVIDRRASDVGLEGACWTEDVSDAAVWTIVGTDCASYTFWTPSEAPDQSCFNRPFHPQATTSLSSNSNPITPFPILADIKDSPHQLTVTGENLTRDLSVWLGDIKTLTDYKSRDMIVCTLPSLQELLSTPVLINDGVKKKLPILLVRGDGVVYKTNQFYTF